MQTSNYSVINRKIDFVEKVNYTGNNNVDIFHFDFDLEWDAFNDKFFILNVGGKCYIDQIDENNDIVLRSVAYDNGNVSFGVCGIHGNAKLSSNMVWLETKPSAFGQIQDVDNLPNKDVWVEYTQEMLALVAQGKITLEECQTALEDVIRKEAAFNESYIEKMQSLNNLTKEIIKDFTVVPQMFQFTKAKLKNNLTINVGKSLSVDSQLTINNYNNYLVNSQYGCCSNPFKIKYEDGTPIISEWNMNRVSTSTAIFVIYFRKDGSYLLQKNQNSPTISIIPEDAYYAITQYYSNQTEFDHYFEFIDIDWLNKTAIDEIKNNTKEFITDFLTLPNQFKFRHRKLRNNLILKSGKTLSTASASSITIDSFEDYLVDSSVGSISEPFRIKYDDGTPIIIKWNMNRTSTSNAVFVWYFDKQGNYLQYRSQSQITNNEGIIPENAYYAMITYYSNLSEYDHYFDDVNVEWINPKPKEYWVGNTSSDDFSSILSCFDALKNDTDEKTIYIRPGMYDIFQEMGGSEFALNIQNGTTWQDVSVFVPENTHIIGLGNVELNLLPEANQISEAGSHLLSILNVKGNCTIENLILNAKNVRYCIHDEVGTDTAYYFKKHTYKNIQCNYQSTAYNGIGGQSYAAGFVNGNRYEFENCKFKTNVGKSACSFHNGANGTGNIIFKNCIFESFSNAYSGLSFNNTSVNQHTINVKISNCFVGSKGLTLGNNISSTNVKNNFKIIANNCNDFNVTVVDTITNILEVEKYNSIS